MLGEPRKLRLSKNGWDEGRGLGSFSREVLFVQCGKVRGMGRENGRQKDRKRREERERLP